MWSDVLTKPKQGRPFYIMRAELMNCPDDYDDAAEAALTHPKLLPRNEGAATTAVDDSVLKKAVFDSFMSMPKQTDPVKHRRSVLGDPSNQGLPGGKKGSRKPSGAHQKHAPTGARYPAHVARVRYQSILAGWKTPEYQVLRQ